MKIIQHKNFERMYKSLDKKIQTKVLGVLVVFIKDPFADKLNNHKLQWIYDWFRSINVTGDYRIVFRELSDGRYELIELNKVWTHSQLYR